MAETLLRWKSTDNFTSFANVLIAHLETIYSLLDLNASTNRKLSHQRSPRSQKLNLKSIHFTQSLRLVTKLFLLRSQERAERKLMRTMEHAGKTRVLAPEFASKRLATASDSTLAMTARWTLPTQACPQRQHLPSTR